MNLVELMRLALNISKYTPHRSPAQWQAYTEAAVRRASMAHYVPVEPAGPGLPTDGQLEK